MKNKIYSITVLFLIFILCAENIAFPEDVINKEEVQRLLGDAYSIKKDYVSAEKEYRDIISADPKNVKARIALADILSWQKKYKESISEYNNVLAIDPGNIEAKRKLADVLSWDKDYKKSIELYNEILQQSFDTKVAVQKARVLGWERNYSESIKVYKNILNKQYNELVDLEMRGKEAYWNNRIKKAIELYTELIDKDPENIEAMFDLSQIYSYQSMWKDTISEYNKILATAPSHFRAQEGLEKSELISKHLLLTAGDEYLQAESQIRDTDINKNSGFIYLKYPLNYNFYIDFAGKYTHRSFKDFSNVNETEGRLKLTYIKNPCWWAEGFYDYISYTRNIDNMQTYGANFNFRFLECITSSTSYEKERLENNSIVIRENYYSNNFKERLLFDATKRLKVGADIVYADYSDDNNRYEPGLDVLYYLSLEPKAFTVKYRCSYKNFKENVNEYFSPQNFWTNTITIDWKHYLNKDEVFFGANDFYYDLSYACSVDSEYVVGHTFTGGIYLDITKRLNFNINGSYTHSSSSIYEEKKAIAAFKYYF